MPARLTVGQVRERLRLVGVRRHVLRQQQEQLLTETVEALQQAHGVVPIAEAARLCGVARSTAYVLERRGKGEGDVGTATAGSAP